MLFFSSFTHLPLDTTTFGTADGRPCARCRLWSSTFVLCQLDSTRLIPFIHIRFAHSFSSSSSSSSSFSVCLSADPKKIVTDRLWSTAAAAATEAAADFLLFSHIIGIGIIGIIECCCCCCLHRLCDDDDVNNCSNDPVSNTDSRALFPLFYSFFLNESRNDVIQRYNKESTVTPFYYGKFFCLNLNYIQMIISCLPQPSAKPTDVILFSQVFNDCRFISNFELRHCTFT